MAARRGGRGSRTGTFLVLVGIVGVLSATFLAGVWTGHNWPVLFGQARPPATEPSTSRRSAERPRPAETLPTLTFYDELRAPLTAPPPPPRRSTKPVEPVRRETSPESPPAVTSPEPAPPLAEPAAPPPALQAEAAPTTPADASARFTVQVGAYNVRIPADTLRATLVSAGHDARVVEAVTPGGVRYRVQVGAFATRQAAQETAARITAERALQTFVTTR